MKNPGEFIKNILTIAKGAVISQAILVLATPLLTRIYNPKDFGELALFVSIASIAGGILTLKFEQAIILPKKDGDAMGLFFLTFIIPLAIGIISIPVFFVLYFFVKIKFLYALLPLGIIGIAVVSAFQGWFSRKKHFKIVSKAAVINSFFNVGVSLLISFLVFIGSGKLIIGYISGFIFSIIFYLFLFFRSRYWRLFLANIQRGLKYYIQLIIEYRQFPFYVVLVSLLGTLSYQIMPILLDRFFSVQDVGYYSLANRILVLPTILIGTAVGDVFRVEIAKRKNNNEIIMPLFKATVQKLMLGGFFIYGFFIFVSPIAFRLVFGEKFRLSGEYAQLLSVAVFGQFLMIPFNYVYIVLNRMNAYFIFQLFLVILPVLSVFTAAYIYSDIKYAFIYLSVATIMLAIADLFFLYMLLKREYQV